MILRRALEAYRNDIFPPHPDAAPVRGAALLLAENATHFSLSEDAVELARGLSGPDMSDAALLDLFRGEPLRRNPSWVELIDISEDGEAAVPVALLLTRTEGPEALHITPFVLMGEKVSEPLFGVRANLESGEITVHDFEPACDIFRAGLVASGVPEEEVDDLAQDIIGPLSENTLRVAKTVFQAFRVSRSRPDNLMGLEDVASIELNQTGIPDIGGHYRFMLTDLGRARLAALRGGRIAQTARPA
jgi:hypothetical protein